MIVQRIRLSSYHRLSYVLLCVRIAIFESSNIHVLIVWIELCESGMDNEENRKDLFFRVKMDNDSGLKWKILVYLFCCSMKMFIRLLD